MEKNVCVCEKEQEEACTATEVENKYMTSNVNIVVGQVNFIFTCI